VITNLIISTKVLDDGVDLSAFAGTSNGTEPIGIIRPPSRTGIQKIFFHPKHAGCLATLSKDVDYVELWDLFDPASSVDFETAPSVETPIVWRSRKSTTNTVYDD
jgi:hypothetical protein